MDIHRDFWFLFFAVDKVQLINTVINKVFHNCVGRIKLYVMDRVNMYFLGHGACPICESSFLNMGKQLSPDGQNCFPTVARYGHLYPCLCLQNSDNGE